LEQVLVNDDKIKIQTAEIRRGHDYADASSGKAAEFFAAFYTVSAISAVLHLKVRGGKLATEFSELSRNCHWQRCVEQGLRERRIPKY
jgi:hypothetical protein